MIYNRDYRRYIVKLIVKDGKATSKIFCDLNLSKNTVNRWIKAYQKKLKQK